jgi:transcriptional regulator with XRE-family HTH domain
MQDLGVDRRGDIDRALGRAIAEARSRIAPAYTQPQLAKDLGLSLRNYKRIESGDVRCPPDTLRRIAHYLGTHGWELFKIAEDAAAQDDSDDDGPETSMRSALGLK